MTVLYEVADGAVRKYYSIAGQTVAMDDGVSLKYLLTDYLGSVVAVTNASGTLISQQRYLPFGQVRTGIGPITQTDFGFTGQRNLDAQGNAFLGLLDYRARMYDPLIGRFLQPDTIIPNFANPQSWNRYAYVLNDPINLVDPSGHFGKCRDKSGYRCKITQNKVSELEQEWRWAKNLSGLRGDIGEDSIPTAGSSGDDDYCLRHPIECGFGGSGTGGTGGTAGTGGYGGIYAALASIEELFNWSLTTPGEMTIYQTPGYPLLGGMRVFYQPVFTLDNGQPVTIGPISIGFGSVTLGFNGTLRYKEGLNSISALGISLPGNYQPWALKISMDTKIPTGGSTSFTHRIGFEYTARPDNIAYAPVVVYAAMYIYSVITTGNTQLKWKPAW